MEKDPFVDLKAKQREGWSTFAPLEIYTSPVAGHLVRFAGIRDGQKVLDVATGTGVVAVTARRTGARVTGLDLTPALLERARENAAIAEVADITWIEGDAEALPFEDASFDVVTSQFGHMFAPRAEVVTRELLRVLKPGGTLAFATWPPEHYVGRFFALVGRLAPPPPPGVTPPPSWGDPNNIRARLGDAVHAPFFERGTMTVSALSPQHFRLMSETIGPLGMLLKANAEFPDRVAAIRKDLETLASQYFKDNVVTQDYLLTRATKVD